LTRLLIPILLAGTLPAASLAEDLAERSRRIMRQSAVTYTTSFLWPCSASTWTRVTENPLMLGQLWQAFGYAPSYDVHVIKGILHVEDPTGLKGKVHTFQGDAGERIYVCDGEVDHWAVPLFNAGEAVFVLKGEKVADGVRGDLSVYVRSTSLLGNAVLELGESILLKHIENRISLNLQDATRIVEAIELAPETVLGKLSGHQAKLFESLFLP
jgi:hypothetical protein